MKRLLPALLLLPVLALAWFGGRWWWGERQLVALTRQLDVLEQAQTDPAIFGSPLTIERWQALEAQAQQVLELRPASPQAWHALSRVQGLRRQAPPWADEDVMEDMDLATLFAPWTAADTAALEALRRATQLQPASSYYRLLLAARKQAMGQYDAELLQALQDAYTLAPHFVGTQPALTRLAARMLPGLEAFPELLAFARDYLQQVLAPGAMSPGTQLGILRQENALPLACPLLDLGTVHDSVANACAPPSSP